jgi:hypothetical protein
MQSGTSGYIRTIVQAPDGSIWIGGNFTNLTDANGDYLSRWNGSAFVSVGTGVTGPVYTIAFAPNGDAYIGGSFLNVTDANGDNITKWNGAAFSSLGTGCNSSVTSLVFDKNGTLYAGGDFTLAGGVANTAYIAQWNGSVWAPLTTGTNGPVNALALGKDNALYAGGQFALAGGIANTLRIARWKYDSDIASYAWAPLSTGMDNTVQAMTVAPNGTLYIGGDFANAGGVPANGLASWNGSIFSNLGDGIDVAAGKTVYSLLFGPDNNLYIAGDFTISGDITPPDSAVMWTGSAFVPLDINFPGASSIFSMLYDKSGNFYIGFSTAGAAVSATVVSPNVGSSIAYPIVTYTGPGTLYQLKNYTTNRSIFFNLTLLAGETAVLNLDPMHPSFISSFRGDIWGSAILPGSNLNWFMQPGANNISSFIYGSTTSATAITIRWQDQYNSTDAAVWK